jgi:hypothetical protein
MTRTSGSLLAGARQVAVEPMPEEARLVFHLLESAGMNPILAYHDDSGVPHPIDADEPFTLGSGLMLPVTTSFAVYVPESEAADAQRVLQDAGRAVPEAGDSSDAGAAQDDGDAGPAGPEDVDQD